MKRYTTTIFGTVTVKDFNGFDVEVTKERIEYEYHRGWMTVEEKAEWLDILEIEADKYKERQISLEKMRNTTFNMASYNDFFDSLFA